MLRKLNTQRLYNLTINFIILVWEFEAEILILNHPTTISKNYEAMIHVGAVRQTAKILTMGKEVLRTGDRDRIRFRFTRFVF